MKEVLRTTNQLTILRAQDLLEREGIVSFEFDRNVSVLHGSLPIMPQRLMVADRDLFMATAILRDNEIE